MAAFSVGGVQDVFSWTVDQYVKVQNARNENPALTNKQDYDEMMNYNANLVDHTDTYPRQPSNINATAANANVVSVGGVQVSGQSLFLGGVAVLFLGLAYKAVS